jgi:hypothetical protein
MRYLTKRGDPRKYLYAYTDLLAKHEGMIEVSAEEAAILLPIQQGRTDVAPEPASFHCPLCDAVFDKEASLRAHKMGKHRDRGKSAAREGDSHA